MSRDEIIRMALEALKLARSIIGHPDDAHSRHIAAVISALRAALEQPEQEPKWTLSCGCPSQYGGIPAEWQETDREGKPAVAYGVICERHWHEYETHPPRREWRGLTDEEIEDCWDGYLSDYQLQMIRTIEAKLKEKNYA